MRLSCFSACCFTKANERYRGDAKLAPTAAAVVKYIERMKKSTYSETTRYRIRGRRCRDTPCAGSCGSGAGTASGSHNDAAHCPGRQDEDGSTQQKGGITKTGNPHLRRLLLKAANCAYSSRLTPGKKSKALRERQEDRSREIVAYADRALIRLRKRAFQMAQESKNANIIKAAVAREPACFLWGMATGNIA